ncbi:MAG: hypothetical protein GAK45_00573 [Pseudomonas citronellolis]|nr:MAG: hypothetical protein GAK45_00573 [Pseudomonas citronellolis]
MTGPLDLSAWGEKPPEFVRLLAAEVARSNRTEAGRAIGMSRSTVSTILANCYPSPSTKSVERRVLDALGQIECPAQACTISAAQCAEYLQRPVPINNPIAMRAWKACRACPRNPQLPPRKHAEEPSHANDRIAVERLDA